MLAKLWVFSQAKESLSVMYLELFALLSAEKIYLLDNIKNKASFHKTNWFKRVRRPYPCAKENEPLFLKSLRVKGVQSFRIHSRGVRAEDDKEKWRKGAPLVYFLVVWARVERKAVGMFFLLFSLCGSWILVPCWMFHPWLQAWPPAIEPEKLSHWG